MTRAKAQWLQKYLDDSYFSMYYAGYADDDCGDIAIFQTKEQRDAWLKEKSFFDRVALTLIDVICRFGLALATAAREKDELDDSIIWIVYEA